MRRPFPDLPGISAFPELNVRTYVELDGKPGVWFLSLDAANWLAVHAARAMFHLPYYHARMQFEQRDDGIHFASHRLGNQARAEFTATYRPLSEPFESRPGTLEYFLTERYCLYAQSPRGQLFRGEVHHLPWQLQRAEADLDPTSLLATHGIEIGPEPPLLHFSPGVAVVVWPLVALS